MKKIYLPLLILFLLCRPGYSQQVLVYHTIQTDSSGKMAPWYNSDPGISYDHDLQLIWNFWKNIPSSFGAKYYMTDHSYSPQGLANMVGGDQFAMALSSWSLYYAYTGDVSLIDNMKYIADTYLANSLSASTDAWPYLPYPSNYSQPSLPVYDGDYILGPGYTQPDKAGSIANELVTLFKLTSDSVYLKAAINIANTLALKVQPGDSATSPYPFKVNAHTGALPVSILPGSNYTTDFVPTLLLFESLKAMGQGNITAYDSAYNTIKTWIQRYPQRTNNWGCFFEDIVGPSNTETNAVTMARYILNHPDWDNTYQQDARAILDWTFNTFADTVWNQYGTTAIFEQSVDLKPGGSHTSRYASTELQYSDLTGDATRVEEAIRQLNWATYLVDTTGQVRFSPSEGSIWYTDGYGDYVRHYIRAMGYYPAIAPAGVNHLLSSTSVVTRIEYADMEIDYNTWDNAAYETLRLTSKPLQVTIDGVQIAEQSSLNGEGWTWTAYNTGGALKLQHTSGKQVKISWYSEAVKQLGLNEVAMNLYPNPASTHVMLTYTLTSPQNVSIDLYSLSGQKLSSLKTLATATNNSTDMSLEGLASGVYWVKLITAQGSCVKKLFINR